MKGKTVYIKALAVTDVTENGEQEVFFHYNGTLRSGMICFKMNGPEVDRKLTGTRPEVDRKLTERRPEVAKS